jgi:hypothetical protein
MRAIARLLYRDRPSAPEDKRQLAAHAKRLIDDPVLALCFERIEADLAGSILNSEVGQAEQREAAYRLNWAARQVKAQLQRMLNDGKLIEAMAKQKEREEAVQRRQRELATAA